ncbi:NAD(+) kinase [Buchnera aphidicola]|uniref:NAD kinase n=1 Tax=Buchnera aphidicola (Stegophylla sp.) TaxID=2315800 RepID=A0A4D6Y9E9_9GAMM|nr:NAD(+) kinase [Buchnera aphidicola (Stegophylla sp.)]QCI26317.1 NAD(+) kinase [Buchnera aphidicola (Stegophylla sp.)]
MKKKFNWIAIVGYPRYSSSFFTHKVLYYWLTKNNYNVVIERSIAKILNFKNARVGTLMEIGSKCDLAIVVGGDGNMLYVSRILSYYPISIIGVNRGNLGFLTDLNPDTVIISLSKILSGEYSIERRFLLEVSIVKNHKKRVYIALNEFFLHSEEVTHMIEFEVFIDQKFSFYQKSDGLIISTPTGSTGYSLSSGGPILFSSLEAIILVSIFPHTLFSRPIVIHSNSIIVLKLFYSDKQVNINCDSQVVIPVDEHDKIIVRKSKNYLNLIHPKSYHYFNILSSKLNWSKNFF